MFKIFLTFIKTFGFILIKYVSFFFWNLILEIVVEGDIEILGTLVCCLKCLKNLTANFEAWACGSEAFKGQPQFSLHENDCCNSDYSK